MIPKLWGDFIAEIRTFLEDKTEGRHTWSNTELTQYLNWALEDFVIYVPRQRRATYTEDDTEIYLPGDFYQALYVEFPDKQFIEGLTIIPGTQFYSRGTLSSGSLPNCWTSDAEKLYLWRNPGGTWYLHYLAYYPVIEEMSAQVLVPRWAYRALTYFVAAQAISKSAIGEAQLNRWKTRRDAGKPTDSALGGEAARLMEEYRALVLARASDSAIIQTHRPRQRTR